MRPSLPIWIVVVLAAVLSTGVGILGLLEPATLFGILGYGSDHVSGLTRQLATYVGSRDLVIGVGLVVLLAIRSTALPVVAILAATSNALDALDAAAFHRWAQLPGALFVAIALGTAAWWLMRRPPQWRRT